MSTVHNPPYHPLTHEPFPLSVDARSEVNSHRSSCNSETSVERVVEVQAADRIWLAVRLKLTSSQWSCVWQTNHLNPSIHGKSQNCCVMTVAAVAVAVGPRDRQC